MNIDDRTDAAMNEAADLLVETGFDSVTIIATRISGERGDSVCHRIGRGSYHAQSGALLESLIIDFARIANHGVKTA